ncbi:5715_t:CDS:1, partial [Acaulospora morrowiae]
MALNMLGKGSVYFDHRRGLGLTTHLFGRFRVFPPLARTPVGLQGCLFPLLFPLPPP